MKKKSKKYAAVAFGIILTVCVLTVCIGIFAGGLRGSKGDSGNVEEPMVEEGVYVEKAELPFYKNASGKYVAKDKKLKKAIVEWNKMFVYQGRRYIEATSGWYARWMPRYRFDESKDVWEVVEEDDSDDTNYLGLAKGEVSEDALFSGNVRGRVYSVEGIEPEFMLRVESLGKRGRSEIYICDSGYCPARQTDRKQIPPWGILR